ncbi:hypothetical protein DFJ74DRAFT_768334 [Hyaloraphidium curvatum]|nr:hypothetical protein DFJ74DRAFT_768334 [Hyaloraphidium curvatum]
MPASGVRLFFGGLVLLLVCSVAGAQSPTEATATAQPPPTGSPWSEWRCLSLCAPVTGADRGSIYVRRNGLEVACLALPGTSECEWHSDSACRDDGEPPKADDPMVLCSEKSKRTPGHWCFEANWVLVRGLVSHCNTTAVSSTVTMSKGTPVYVPAAIIPETNTGRCGIEFGRKCRAGICCSRWGYCEDDGGDSGAAWCGLGCQLGYGKCWVEAETTSTASPTSPTTASPPPPPGTTTTAQETEATPTLTYTTGSTVSTTLSSSTAVYAPCTLLPSTPNGRCGPAHGNARCPDNLCCSAAGYCEDDGGDSGEAWCGPGCQLGYGKCFYDAQPATRTTCMTPTYPKETTSAFTPVLRECETMPETKDGRCGWEFATRCRVGLCCSSIGYCEDDGGDSGEAWCGAGCQQGYGKCFLDGLEGKKVACPWYSS